MLTEIDRHHCMSIPKFIQSTVCGFLVYLQFGVTINVVALNLICVIHMHAHTPVGQISKNGNARSSIVKQFYKVVICIYT